MSEPTRTEPVEIDGDRFDLHLWVPDQGHGPGVLLLHEIFGVGDYIQAVAARLARRGYVVGAPDLFWRLQRNFTAPHTEAGMGEAFQMVSRFDVDQGVVDAVAALDHLRGLTEVQGGVAALGFCLGGTMAHLVGAAGDPDAVVSYYGSGVAGAIDQLGAIRCPALYHFGGADPFIPSTDVDVVATAIEASGRDDVTLLVQAEAGHAFDNHEAPTFHDAEAAARAWAATEAFLADHLRHS